MGKLKDIPTSWLIALLILGLVILRAMDIDSYITAGIGLIIGYLTGQHIGKTYKGAKPKK